MRSKPFGHLTIRFAFVILCLSFFNSVYSQSTPVDPQHTVPLTHGWNFTPANGNSSKIEVSSGLSAQDFLPPVHGSYEIDLFWPEADFYPAQGIYLNRVQEADRFYINGTLVGKTGDFPPYAEYQPNWFLKRLYFIPETLIKKGELNSIRIEVYYQNPSTPGGLFRSVPLIGNYSELQARLFEEDGRDAAIIMLFFGIGAYQIFHVIIKRQTRSNFFLLLATVFFVGWRMPLQNVTYSYFDFYFPVVLRVFNVFQAIFPLTLLLLCYSIFQYSFRKLEYALVGFILSIALIHSFDIPIHLRYDLLLYWEISLLLLTFLVMRSVIKAIQEKKPEAYFLGVGFGILCIAGIIDILIDQTSGKNIYLTQYGFLVLMILSAVSISYRNAQIEKELSVLTKDLEGRVKIRTNELIYKNQEMEKDLNLAAQLQVRLLPNSAPKIERIRMEASYIPMAKVGGDLYDWVEVDHEKLLFFIADVTGHGVASALISSMVKVQFREIAKRSIDPGKILSTMNQSIKGFLNKNFVTASCALFDLSLNEMMISSAAHPSPYHFKKGTGAFQPIDVRGAILGLNENFDYKQLTIPFSIGDRFFFYTDGVTEARTSDKSLYGEDRLLSCLERTKNEHVSIVTQAILSEITLHSENVFKDDVSFVNIEIR